MVALLVYLFFFLLAGLLWWVVNWFVVFVSLLVGFVFAGSPPSAFGLLFLVGSWFLFFPPCGLVVLVVALLFFSSSFLVGVLRGLIVCVCRALHFLFACVCFQTTETDTRD